MKHTVRASNANHLLSNVDHHPATLASWSLSNPYSFRIPKLGTIPTIHARGAPHPYGTIMRWDRGTQSNDEGPSDDEGWLGGTLAEKYSECDAFFLEHVKYTADRVPIRAHL